MLKNIFLSKNKIFFLYLINAFAIAIAAQITIPFQPVPFTLQTFIIAILILRNPYNAFISVCTYVLLGLFGLPVFANLSSAVITFQSPSWGYIVGMLIGTFMIYKINIKNDLYKLCIFNFLLYLFGLIPLSIIFGIKDSIYFGLTPFILSDIIKMSLAYFIVKNYINKKL